MSKKQNRKRRTQRQAQPLSAGRSKRKRRIATPLLFVIGLILLMVGVLAIASLIGGDPPICPPGQVWSQAHGHCH